MQKITIETPIKKISKPIVKRILLPGKPGKDGEKMTKEEILAIVRPMLESVEIPDVSKFMKKNEVDKIVEAWLKGYPKITDDTFNIETENNITTLTINGKKHVIPLAAYAPKLRNFVQMGDTPDSYTGKGGKAVKVKSDETGLEFGEVSGGTPTLQEVTDEGNETTNNIIIKRDEDTFGVQIQDLSGNDRVTAGHGQYGDGFIQVYKNDDTVGVTIEGDAVTVGDEAYGSGWDGSMEVPTKNALYDKIETIGGGTPGGSNTNVQINDSGAFYGDSGFAYNKTTKRITSTIASLGTTPTDSYLAQNTTAATSGNQQVSPSITKTGQGWKTDGGGASQAVDFRNYVLPVQGTSNPSLIDKNQFRINGGTWTDAWWYDSRPGGQGFAFYTPSGQSNGAAGTTRIVTFNNTGGNTWLDFNFTGTRKSSLGADDQGQMIADTSSNNGFVVRVNGTAFHYLGNGALLTYGYGGFQTGINAGSTNVNTSTLQSSGGLGLKVKKLTVSGSLDNSATHWLLDGTNSFVCSGTPTYDCSHWANETECLANDAHGGPCAWSAGSDCSVFNNEYGMGSCSSNPGCSVTTDACTGGDEATCIAPNSAPYYGGTCSWSAGTDCSAFNGNESGCSGQTGCSVSSGNSCPSQFDEWSCNGVGGCYWDGMSCTGDNSTCTGTYGAGCSGTYNTGGCTGTYGSGCSGTSSCSGINDSTSCTAESGCTSAYIITGNLPDGELYPDRTYWALNDSSTSADAVLLPYSGQTINMTTSLTLSNYKDGVHIAYYKDLGDCSIYNSNESTCGSTPGCTQGYIDCAGYTDEGNCVADTHCSWNGASCDGGVYFSNCSGSYVIAKNWYVWSRT